MNLPNQVANLYSGGTFLNEQHPQPRHRLGARQQRLGLGVVDGHQRHINAMNAYGSSISGTLILNNSSVVTGGGSNTPISFAGGMMGYLASRGNFEPKTLKEAMAYGVVVASFNVEDFSLDRMQQIDRPELDGRLTEYRDMLSF